MRAFSDNLIFSVLLLIVQILSFASGTVALAAGSIGFDRPVVALGAAAPFRAVAAASPVSVDVDEIVTDVETAAAAWDDAAVDVVLLGSGSGVPSVATVGVELVVAGAAATGAAAVAGGDPTAATTVTGTGLDWAMLEMIMSLW